MTGRLFYGGFASFAHVQFHVTKYPSSIVDYRYIIRVPEILRADARR